MNNINSRGLSSGAPTVLGSPLAGSLLSFSSAFRGSSGSLCLPGWIFHWTRRPPGHISDTAASYSGVSSLFRFLFLSLLSSFFLGSPLFFSVPGSIFKWVLVKRPRVLRHWALVYGGQLMKLKMKQKQKQWNYRGNWHKMSYLMWDLWRFSIYYTYLLCGGWFPQTWSNLTWWSFINRQLGEFSPRLRRGSWFPISRCLFSDDTPNYEDVVFGIPSLKILMC